MAKAKEIVGLDCTADALRWAAKVLRVRFDEMIERRDAALDFSDIEGVHAMRVASRRLRSAMRDFLPLLKKRPLRRVRKKLKEIADALGAVRDQDVAILALENLQSAAEIDQIGEQSKEGIEILIEERRRIREKARANLAKTLADANIAALAKDFTDALEKAFKKNKRRRVVSFNEAGREAVNASLEELRALGWSVYEPFNIEKLHEMRIAAKRLRYAVELFTACWGEKVAPFAAEIAELQSLLGEVHDCDIWLESLGARMRGRQSGAATPNPDKAAVWLLSKFIKNRTKNYCAVLKLWSEWETTDFTRRMQAAIA